MLCVASFGEQVDRVSSALADVDIEGWTQRFDLLSDPHRLEILLSLHRVPDICVGELAQALGRSENAVSQALRILRHALPSTPKAAPVLLAKAEPVALANAA